MNMKRILPLVSLMIITAFIAVSFISPGTYHDLDADDPGVYQAGPTLQATIVSGTLTFSGFGAMYSTWDNPSDVPWYSQKDNITGISLSSRQTSIAPYAFYGLSKVETVYIPSSVDSVDSTAFRQMTKLETISVSPTNPKLYVENGCLVHAPNGKDNTNVKAEAGNVRLVAFPMKYSETTIIMPNNIITVDPYAFEDHITLLDIIFTERVDTVGAYAFKGCTSLVSAVLDNGCRTIGASAFEGCSELQAFYAGTSFESFGVNSLKDCPKMTVFMLRQATAGDPTGMKDAITGTTVAGAGGNEKWFPTRIFSTFEIPTSTEAISVSDIETDMIYTKGTSIVNTNNHMGNLYWALPFGSTIDDADVIIAYSKNGAGTYQSTIPNVISFISLEVTTAEGTVNGWRIPIECLHLTETGTLNNQAFPTCELTNLYLPSCITPPTKASNANWFFGRHTYHLQTSPDVSGNFAFIAQDGCLYYYSGDSKILFYTPSGTGDEIMIRDDVDVVRDYTFYVNSSYRMIYIPDLDLNWQSQGGSVIPLIQIPSTVTAEAFKAYARDHWNADVIMTALGRSVDNDQNYPTNVLAFGNASSYEQMSYTYDLDDISVPSSDYKWYKDGTSTTVTGKQPWGHYYILAQSAPTVGKLYYDANGKAAASGTYSGVDWYITEQGTLCFFVGQGTSTHIIPDFSANPTGYWFGATDIAKIKRIAVQEGITQIGTYAFAKLENAEILAIPHGMKYIGKGALDDLALTTLYLPRTVESIGYDPDATGYDPDARYKTDMVPLLGSTTLKQIIMVTCQDGDMSVYSTKDGILYKGDIVSGVVKRGLYAINCPTKLTGTASLHASATKIENGAFDSSSLTYLDLSPATGLTTIGSNFMKDAKNLTELTIPGSVTSVGGNSIQGCTSLMSLNLGTSSADTHLPGMDGGNTHDMGGVLTGASSFMELIIYDRTNDWTMSRNCLSYTENETTKYHDLYLYDTKQTYDPSTLKYTIAKGGDVYSTYEISADTPIYGTGLFYKLTSTGLLLIQHNNPSATADMTQWYEDQECTDRIDEWGEVPWYIERNDILKVKLPDTLTGIGNYAFKGTNITEVSFPTTLTKIDDYSFQSTGIVTPFFTGSSQLTIGKGAFQGCEDMTSVSFAGPVSLGDDAFKGCSLLTQVNFKMTAEPSAMSTVGTDAFATGASALTVNSDFMQPSKEFSPFASEITGPATVTMTYVAHRTSAEQSVVDLRWHVEDVSTRKNAKLVFDGTATETGDFTLATVPWKAFSGTIDTIALDSDLNTIGTFAFAGCTALESYSIPDTVTTVKSDAFSGCSGLRTVTILSESPAITLSTGVFRDLTKLYTVNMPANLYLDSDHQAFTGCTGIREINLTSAPGYTYTVGGNAYAPWMVTQSALTVTTTKDVTSLGDYMFRGCTKLEVLKLDEKTVSLGQSALEGCTGLKELDMSTLSTIGTDALKDLSGIKTLTMPLSMTDDDIFGGTSCQALELVNLTGTACPDYTCAAVDGGETSTYLNAPWQKVNQNNVVVTLMDSVDKIGDFFMYECDYVQIFTVPSSAGSIGDHAFYGCGQLAVINLLTTTAYPMDKIGSYAFETKIYDPDPSDENDKGTTLCCRFANSITIGDDTMEWIEALYTNEKATRPVYPIAEGATATTLYYENGIPYKQCGKSLYVKWIPGGNTIFFLGTGDMYPFIDDTGQTPGSAEFIRPWQVASWTVEGETIYHQYEGITITQSMLDAITAVSFCDGMTSIGDKALYSLVNLSDASVPSTVKKIGDYAFYACSLTGYQDLTSVTSVGTHAFEGNDTLDWIKLPYDATVGADAFKGCDGVYLYATGTQGKSPAPTTVSYPEAAKPLRVIMLSGVEANFVNQDGLAFVPGSVWSTSGGLATSIAQGKVYVAGDTEDFESDDNVYTASTSSTISF